MTDAIEQAFLSGSGAVIDASVASSPAALTVDWRTPAAEIAGDIEAIVAEHGVAIELDDSAEAGRGSVIDMLSAWNAALLPRIEIRVLRSTIASDTQVVLIESADWWSRITKSHPELSASVFEPLPPSPTVSRKPRQERRSRSSRCAQMLRFPGEWIADARCGPEVLERALAGLQSAFGSPHLVGQAVVSLRQLGTFHQLAGQAAILSGDEAGWQSVRLGYRFASIAVHLSDRLFAADSRPDKPPRTDEWEIGRVVALGLALDAPHSDKAFEIFRRRMTAGTLGQDRGPFARYINALCQVRDDHKAASDVSNVDLGPWRGLFIAWDSNERFAVAMLAALEYHVERSKPSSRFLGEFEGGPEQAFVSELVGLVRIRESQGVSTPQIDHPLWQTPLVTTHPSGPFPEDALLSRCAAFADEVELLPVEELMARNRPPSSAKGIGNWIRRLLGRRGS
ncbi:MAG: hypothetical protein AB7I19_14770 [Planctomycetota bacterium]